MPLRRLAPLPTLWALWALCLLWPLLAGPANAADSRPAAGAPGYVDWERQVAVGVGSAPVRQAAGGPTQARALAQRAAMLDARRNLLEVIGQVRVDSASVVQNFMTASDRVTSTVQGMLAGATVAAERLLPDGTYEVTLAVPLSGPLTQEVLAPGRTAGAPAPAAPAQPQPVPPAAAADGSNAALQSRLYQIESSAGLVENHLVRREARVAALERKAPAAAEAGGAGAALAGADDAAVDGRLLRLETRTALLENRTSRLEIRVAALERAAPNPAGGQEAAADATPASAAVRPGG